MRGGMNAYAFPKLAYQVLFASSLYDFPNREVLPRWMFAMEKGCSDERFIGYSNV
jgi:hypothetical protein